MVLQLEESKTPRLIFEQAGFDVEMIGMKRIEAAASRQKKAYKKSGVLGLTDTRQTNPGRCNPYKKIVKATEEHRVVPNLLNREFKQDTLGKILLTDITYVYYGNGQLAYLSTISDARAYEILSYHVSDSIKLPLVTETIEKLFKNKRVPLHPEAMIHSDQGAHYTSPTFQALLKKKGLRQSMSRRGNCWDNAPQESFFGHFKDEALLKECNNLEELKREIKRYIMSHHTTSYQWVA